MALDELERPKRHSCRNWENYGAHQKILNEDIFILSAAKFRLMILVSRNITYMRIFAGMPWERRQLSNDNNGHALHPLHLTWTYVSDLFTVSMCNVATRIDPFLQESCYMSSNKTRKLSYGKHGRAMRAIYGALKIFESPSVRPRLPLPKFFMGFCSDRPYECAYKIWSS